MDAIVFGKREKYFRFQIQTNTWVPCVPEFLPCDEELRRPQVEKSSAEGPTDTRNYAWKASGT